MQDLNENQTVLYHALTVLTELQRYVLLNAESTNVFLDTLLTGGCSLQNVLDFQQQRLHQFRAIQTVLDMAPWLPTPTIGSVNHGHQ